MFAVRVETFPKERETRVFYIGANQPAVLTRLRRHVVRRFDSLPVSGEYIHRGAFDLAERFGKDIFPRDPTSRHRLAAWAAASATGHRRAYSGA